ncbi:MAG: nitrite/sulfite reductase [Bryobacteraceae bacterium]|jgi:sulfite reductase (ferredoxin)
MKASNGLWRERLWAAMPPELAQEIDVFENELALRRRGKLEEALIAETRLRRGVYGQRYDNGQRHDGRATRQLAFPPDKPTKGPHTLWDAPGMQRIKIPFGGLTARQLETLAELAEEYSDGIAHVTTRQDFQLHFVHIEDTPSIMRRLAAVGITTREACGNTVRNVTGCPVAGVCRTQTFDVTPYAKALAYFLLGHPDAQDFGRKFKISFSGCRDEACGLAHMHDFGAIAVERDGKRGFELWVGGGLGAVPQQARLFTEFLPEEELLPVAQAIARVFARLGEKKNRNTARLKFLVSKLGIEEFRKLVAEERASLPFDPRWTDYLKQVEHAEEPRLKPPSLVRIGESSGEYTRWAATNVYPQRQQGYSTVTVALPLGDITADQLRALADIARRFIKDTIRTTVDQNMVLRWVSDADLPELHAALDAAGLAAPGAGTILDVTACPGTDTCKLGIASSRGLAAELRTRLAGRAFQLDEAVQSLRIKISGCFNSCGQHHVADLGFYGVSRKKGDYAVPHFQVVLGGQWTGNAASYGLAVGAVPSKRIPEVVDRITGRYVGQRERGETFQAFIARIGKAECRRTLEDLMEVPPHDADPSLYSDWGDPREFSIGDIATGECAGAVVPAVEFQLAACEREAFEAQLKLEKAEIEAAARQAYESMLHGAAALLRHRDLPFGGSPDEIVGAFRTELVDTRMFWDRFRGGALSNYFFKAHENTAGVHTEEAARQLIEEAQLFIEACHACYLGMAAAPELRSG